VQVHGLWCQRGAEISFQSLDRCRYLLQRELPNGNGPSRDSVSWSDFNKSMSRVVDAQVVAALLKHLGTAIPRRSRMKMRLVKALKARKIGRFEKFVFPIIGHMAEHNLVDQLVTIQPMELPEANTMYMDFVSRYTGPARHDSQYVRRKQVPREEMAFPLDEDKIVNETRPRDTKTPSARIFTRSLYGCTVKSQSKGALKTIVAA